VLKKNALPVATAGRGWIDRISSANNSIANWAQELKAELFAIEGSGGLYHVRFRGELIIQRSRDPEFDLARELLARGFGGEVKIIDALTGKHRSTVNITKAAGLTVKEGAHGPYFAKQTLSDRAPTAETPSPDVGVAGPP